MILLYLKIVFQPHVPCFWTQLFNIQALKKRQNLHENRENSALKMGGVGVHVPISARKSAFASFYFTIKNWHEKTPEAAWFLGVCCLHLLRQHNMVRTATCHKWQAGTCPALAAKPRTMGLAPLSALRADAWRMPWRLNTTTCRRQDRHSSLPPLY